ncbi:cobalt-precorrin-5B (C(1))-methyltransferase [Cyanobacteria bacterium FACHB-472]|nr:cobalt-precorrin-5B (C(1))-methyltransferase [Cyanobacteria bacterium FACHB-472]
MTSTPPRFGYTLPVFACAAAIAALRWLRQEQPEINAVSVDLIEPADTVEIPIEQVAKIGEGMALAITTSDPGDNLDLTRNTPIWVLVEWLEEDKRQSPFLNGVAKGKEESVHSSLQTPDSSIRIKGGEGIGRMVNAGDKPAIYAYAQRLLQENLQRLLSPEEKIQVTIILPFGRSLAQRTSNAAFGVVDGLSLLGTTGISQPLSATGQLEAFREELQHKAHFDCLVFCVGENGLDLARQLGIHPDRMVKTANWLGPMLVEAGLQQVKSILLFGYHGKLIKLAGGIFHTHHHLADGRMEILTAHCAKLGLPTAALQAIFQSATAEDALYYLRQLDDASGGAIANQVYSSLSEAIDTRSQAYIRTMIDTQVTVGSLLFDRDRQIIVKSQNGAALLYQVC